MTRKPFTLMILLLVVPLATNAKRLGAAEVSPPSHFVDELNKYPVIFIPGITGSKLFKKDKLIWGDLINVATNFDELQLPIPFARDDLVATEILDDFAIFGPFKIEAYSQIVKFYTETLGYQLNRNFFTFAYDWRIPIEDSAAELNRTIEMWRAKNFKFKDSKVILLAHSMGGLVAKSYVKQFAKRDEIARLVFIGTPHLGSLDVFTLLLEGAYGPYSAKARRAAFTFPSVFELLPVNWMKFAWDKNTGDYIDVYDVANWKRYRWFPPDVPEDVAIPHLQQMLTRAKSFQNSIKDLSPMPTMVTFFGYGNKTPVSYEIADGNAGYTIDGDSRVTFSSAVPYTGTPDFETHPITQKHGSLYADANFTSWLSYEVARLFAPDISNIFKSLSGPPPIRLPTHENILLALEGTLNTGVFLDTQLDKEFAAPGDTLEVLGIILVPKGYNIKSSQLALKIENTTVPLRPLESTSDFSVQRYLKNLDLESKKDPKQPFFYSGKIKLPKTPGIYRTEASAVFFVQDDKKGAVHPFERHTYDHILVTPLQ